MNCVEILLIYCKLLEELSDFHTDVIVQTLRKRRYVVKRISLDFRKLIESIDKHSHVLCISPVKFRYEIIDVFGICRIEIRSNERNIADDVLVNLSQNSKRLCYRKYCFCTRRIELNASDSLSDSANHKRYVSCIVLSDSLTFEHRHTISKCLDLIA